jgi:hypothetical protein
MSSAGEMEFMLVLTKMPIKQSCNQHHNDVQVKRIQALINTSILQIGSKISLAEKDLL